MILLVCLISCLSPVRTLTIILCRFWVSQFIVKLYKAPLCLPILILPSPCLFILKFRFLVLITYFDWLLFCLPFCTSNFWSPGSRLCFWINNDFCIHPGLHLVPYLRRNRHMLISQYVVQSLRKVFEKQGRFLCFYNALNTFRVEIKTWTQDKSSKFLLLFPGIYT